MPKINLLPKNVSELIAAGEVVERPASVIKELVENSIDAGASSVTVEIEHGGITYMRVTDNGSGIEYSDVPTSFLRHATSKIKSGADLDAIATLGFRGEALAAVSSVARVEMFTATDGSDFGTNYKIEGGEEVLYTESGCPKGTTIIIRDIFYNTPARMKFLKKDISEANACAAVIERIALSHPEIAFRFIRDGKQALSTAGDNNIKGTVYSVLGREIANSLIEVLGDSSPVTVSGFVCKPISCKPTRNNQFTFLNGRLVRSGTVVAAVEQAYKNSAMVGKFPAFVLYLAVPYNTVDVNVHPAKTEVRFADEKSVFDCIYAAVKNAISVSDTRPEMVFKPKTVNPFAHMTTEQYRQQKLDTEIGSNEATVAEKVYDKKPAGLHNPNNYGFGRAFSDKSDNSANTEPAVLRSNQIPDFMKDCSLTESSHEEVPPKSYENKNSDIDLRVNKPAVNVDITCEEETADIKVIGEAFGTYIIAEMGESVFLIDKHAAHERILFNKLKATEEISVQPLLTPVTAVLSAEEYDAVINNTDLLLKSGFEVEDFGNGAVVVRAIPSFLTGEDVASLISEIAENLNKSGTVASEREDNLFHSVACKAAIKAGYKTTEIEMTSLCDKVLRSKEIMYCPHGRPVAYEIKKRDLEKQFGRIQ